MSASLARADRLSAGHRQRPEFSPHQSDAYSDSLRHRSRGRRQVAGSSWAMAARLAPGITFAWKTPRPAPVHLLATHLWSRSHLHRSAPARWLPPARGAAAPAPASRLRATRIPYDIPVQPVFDAPQFYFTVVSASFVISTASERS